MLWSFPLHFQYYLRLFQKGDPTTGKDELELPAGWEWKDEWQVDLNRAVDDNGGLLYFLDISNNVIYITIIIAISHNK